MKIYLLCTGYKYDPEYNIEGVFETGEDALAAGQHIQNEQPNIMIWTYEFKIFKTVGEWLQSND